MEFPSIFNFDRTKINDPVDMKPADLSSTRMQLDDIYPPEMLFRYPACNWPRGCL